MSKPKDDLISRDAAIEEVEEWAEHGHEVIHWTWIKAMLECLPAVDAIPVEWLEWRVMNAKYNGIKEAADAFDFVLNCWKEQETRST